MATSELLPNGGRVNRGRSSMSSAAGSPVNHSAPRGSVTASTTSGGDGPGWLTSCAQYDPDTSSWRTSQLSLTIPGLSDGSSPTWPSSGSMRHGTCYVRPTSERLTAGSGSISWPTPRSVMSRVKVQPRPKRRAGTNLEEAVYHRTGEHGGYLNPPWIEWLMGFPVGWLPPLSTPSETRPSRNSPSSLGA
jgi:hypothetical protein